MTFRAAIALAFSFSTTACVGGMGSIQPDRMLFSVDGTYQRHSFPFTVEETFERTKQVFREAGYKLDVSDNATGQISGFRGRTGDKDIGAQKGLKFYALVFPGPGGTSQLGVKIVQVIKRGGVLGSADTEVIVSDPQMYQYLFSRIESNSQESPISNLGATQQSGLQQNELPAY